MQQASNVADICIIANISAPKTSRQHYGQRYDERDCAEFEY